MDAWQLIVLAGAVIIVYAYLIPRQSVSNEKVNMLQQLEEAFEHFSMELDEDNEKLLEHIAGLNKESELQTLKLKSRIETLEREANEVKRDVALALTSADHRSSAPSDTTSSYGNNGTPRKVNAISLHNEMPVVEEETLPSLSSQLNMKERYKEVIGYHTEGKSMEFIAKNLGMNKGEIQLIIELARQEEQLRV